MSSKQRDVLPAALSGAVRRSRWLGPRWLAVVAVFLLGCGAGALFRPWDANRAGWSLPVVVVREPAALAAMRDMLPGLAGPSLGVLLALAFGLSAAGIWLLCARLEALARRARLGERLAARLAQALPVLPEESLTSSPSGSGGQLPIAAGADRRLDQLFSGYRAAIALTARVAELERELDGARARSGGAAPKPPNSSPPLESPPASLAIEHERVRQLAEASFLIGSDAMVRVRSAIRLVQECQKRPGAREGDGSHPGNGQHGQHEQRGGVNGGPGRNGRVVAYPRADAMRTPGAIRDLSPAPLGEVFVALAAEVDELSRSARGLRPALEALLLGADSAGTAGGRRNGSLAPHGSGWKSSSGGTVSILKCRALSVELEGGLRRLGAEVQLLSRSRRPLGQGGDSSEVQRETDRGLAHGLRRLELQLEEVATHLASLTRNAEQLSRELDRPQARS